MTCTATYIWQSLRTSQNGLHVRELSVALLEKLNQRNIKYQSFPEDFLIPYMPMKRKEHKCCCPYSLERKGSHFTGFHYREKEISPAAHATALLISPYTTKRRYFQITEITMCTAGSILPFKVLLPSSYLL